MSSSYKCGENGFGWNKGGKSNKKDGQITQTPPQNQEKFGDM